MGYGVPWLLPPSCATELGRPQPSDPLHGPHKPHQCLIGLPVKGLLSIYLLMHSQINK